jgi:predicted small secreted protein
MKKKLIRVIVPIAGALALLFSTGCETTEGFGRDVENLGEGIEEGSREVRR